MKYSNSNIDIRVGDSVLVGDSLGWVTIDFNNNPPEDWKELYDTGVMIYTQKYGLIYFSELDEDVIFIDRNNIPEI